MTQYLLQANPASQGDSDALVGFLFVCGILYLVYILQSIYKALTKKKRYRIRGEIQEQ